MADMKLFLQILANASGLKREMSDSGNAVTRFTSGAKREFDSLKGSMGSLQGKLAGIGLSIGAVQQLSQSARLDKGLTQVRQTAGEGAEMVKGLRKEFFLMSSETGQQVEGLKDGFDSLIQSGQSWKAALESTKGINIASAVTGAQGETLAGALTVGAKIFDIDLTKPGQALELLDKMTVAGRLGSAELGDLAGIFAGMGANAKSAGMGYDATLAFIEALSSVERQPERLKTLADSTLRVFTNLNYMAAAQKKTGVKFFDAKGASRDAVDVLGDIKKKWDTLKTDKERAVFIQQAFGKADLDTIKGMKTLLSGTTLPELREFVRRIGGASGTLKKDLPDAIDNAADQVARLKNNLRAASDSFAQPINKALADLIQWTMKKKTEGGLELSGKEMIAGGGAAVLTALIAKRFGSGIASRLLSRGGSTAVGVAEGKVLEEVAGVKPVFVTNWPAGFGGSVADVIGGATGGAAAGGAAKTAAQKGLGWVAKSGMGIAISELAAAVLSVPVAVGAAGLAGGYAIGKYGINPLARSMTNWRTGSNYTSEGWIGEEIYDALHPQSGQGKSELKNDIKIDVHFDELGRAFTKVNSMNTRTDVKGLNRGSLWDALMTTEGL